jgi:hypothetical protein
LANRTPNIAAVAALFLGLTLLLTWPLARGLARDIPGDFGDPLLNTWILAWDDSHLGRGLWNANIFYPHPLALAYSEHLLPQALEILPVYAATRNPILCYNLLFLSTFVLSGIGMYLFVRELTGNWSAAFVAGLAFAFAPYRIASLPHLQVLSSAWMPFTLYGFRRYFERGRTVALVGATGAWALQNLSCGYYLLFFSPVVILYVVWEMTNRGLWSNWRSIGAVGAAFAVTALICVPFLLPYLELRRLGSSPRSLTETMHFSADVYAYLTADSNLWLWGSRVRAWPWPEGSLFPGWSTIGLALVALIGSLIGPWRETRSSDMEPTSLAQESAVRRILSRLAGWLFAASSLILVGLIFGWTVRLPLGRIATVKITAFGRTALVTTALLTILLALSSRVRRTMWAWIRSPIAIFCLLTVLAAVMSFGPNIHAKGRLVEDTNLYGMFYRYVPGFDGLRVPARFAMVVALGLSVLTGLGVSLFPSSLGRRSVLVGVGAIILAESFAAPIPINQNSPDYKQSGLAPLPDVVSIHSGVPPVYRFLSTLPESSAVVELPLGEPAFDVRYMFYSTLHWRKLVNGYSGGAPLEYEQLRSGLEEALKRPERGWQLVSGTGATHVIVHEAFYSRDRGLLVSQWLRDHGAREVASFGSDHVFALH